MGRGQIEDSALRAGLVRRRLDSNQLRQEILVKAAEKKLANGVAALMFTSEYGKDVDRRIVQIEFEKLADEGFLTRLYQLTCPECGEQIGRHSDVLDPALIGSTTRCRKCKSEFAVQSLDIWVSYTPSDKVTPADPPERDQWADRDEVEEAVKKLLRDQRSFTASEVAEVTGVPIEDVRPWLSVMMDCRDLDALETIRCRGCDKVLLDDPDEVPFKIGHLASCDCGQESFVVTAADVHVAYVGERVHRHRRPSFDSNYPSYGGAAF